MLGALCLRLFEPVAVGERLICLADGIKAPKEGRKMPAVKLPPSTVGQQLKAGLHHGP